MSSSDQSSVAGSVNYKVAVINDSVIPDLVKNLEKIKESLSKTRRDHNNSNSGNNNGNSGNNGSSYSSQDENQSVNNQVEKLRKDLIYIGGSFKNLKGFEDKASGLLKRAIELIKALQQLSSSDDPSRPNVFWPAKRGFRELNKIVFELKLPILLLHKLSSDEYDSHWYKLDGTDLDDWEVLNKLPVVHVYREFVHSSAFRDFRLVYESLELRTKMCLLCFAVIPENEIVKKRFMTYWWVGEEFVSPPLGMTYEEAADKIFGELEKKDCIEPVNEKHRFVVDSYKMNPFIRSAVIVLAKEAGFFDFDDIGRPSATWKSSYRACLVDGNNYQELFISKSESKSKNEVKRGTGLEAEKLRGIFNVNEPYPGVFELEWFSKLKNVKVLYLGRWQTSDTLHIEVESVEFLKGLKSLKRLRFFSFQGVSRITKLPDSVCKLLNLRILDLRACHDLEVLPNGIGSLKKLTHLDTSECYLLENMPKGIGTLDELQVLKGFVISDNSRSKSCTLDDLSKLKNLGKLSIHTNKEAFPETEDVTTLVKFEALQKLTITWGAGAFPTKEDGHAKQGDGAPSKGAIKRSKTSSKSSTPKNAAEPGPINQETPEKLDPKCDPQSRMEAPENFPKLEKLDLKCYPRMEAPSWLLPRNFRKLEKLYIRGGNLENLSPGPEIKDNWKVNILRLNFLSNLKMDWKELLSSFPDMIYLEKYKCPKLTFFPCNENGIKLKPRTDAGRRAAERYNIVH